MLLTENRFLPRQKESLKILSEPPRNAKKAMLNQNELVREAQAKAKEIVDDAKKKSAEIRKATNVYVDSIIKRTEQAIAEQLETIKKTRTSIVNSQKSGNSGN